MRPDRKVRPPKGQRRQGWRARDKTHLDAYHFGRLIAQGNEKAVELLRREAAQCTTWKELAARLEVCVVTVYKWRSMLDLRIETRKCPDILCGSRCKTCHGRGVVPKAYKES